jgi:hypothetical protein
MENTQLKSLQHMQFTEFKTFLSSFQSKWVADGFFRCPVCFSVRRCVRLQIKYSHCSAPNHQPHQPFICVAI